MLVTNPWPAEVVRLGAALLVGALGGLIVGYPGTGMAVVVAFYAGTHARNLARLEHWLRRGRRFRPPQARGVWGTIFDNIYRLQRRHRARRQRLVHLLERVKAASNAMPDATVVLQGEGEMVWWNRLASDYLGLQWPRDQGQHMANLLRHPDFHDFFHAGDWEESVKVPSPVATRRMLEIRIVPYGREQRLLLAREVTRLHRLETMRRDFVANITHELRTPLTVIRGMSETLADEADGSSASTQHALDLIQQQTTRMGRLVDDLLLLSRLETGEGVRAKDPVRVASLVEALRDEAHAFSDKQHRITVSADENLLIRGDQSELRSAFSNLVVNAIKYTPDGGGIDISWFEAGATACLAVADTGPGIPAHHIPRLTERFYRVDDGRSQDAGGTGLGLAIVKHVLSRHGARLEVTSQVEEGSTFTCVFPQYERASGTAAASAP
jgi:two-component system phosphate regulon sensor histidine kinase PhoR